jgi:tetratricopeptide (TPR) repeat protein
MLNIGEYEKAEELSDQIKKSRIKLDDFTQFMLDRTQEEAADKIEKVNVFNSMGIEAFNEKKYHKAFNLFEKALDIAPMNTGSALNLIQVIIEIAKTEPNERWKYVEKGRHVYRIVQDMPLNDSHRKRSEELSNKLKELEDMDKAPKKKSSGW